MKTTITINGITKEIELTDEQAKQFKRHTGYERVEQGEKFYYLNDKNEVRVKQETFSAEDTSRYICGNYFSDERLANFKKKETFLRQKITQFVHSNYGITDSDKVGHHYLCYINGALKVRFSYFKCFGAIELYSQDIAEDVINTFKSQLIDYFKELENV